jgi:hypothetical protein
MIFGNGDFWGPSIDFSRGGKNQFLMFKQAIASRSYKPFLTLLLKDFKGSLIDSPTRVGSVLKATKLLTESNGILQVSEFQKKAGLSGKSQYNILREMRVLGIANVKNEKVSLQVNLSREEKDLEDSLRGYLRDRLRRNRLVWRLLDELKGVELLTLEMISEILMRSCPYISATSQTWRTYARTFVDWMDYSDLAIFDTKEGTLTQFSTRTELRERRILVAQRRKGVMIPCIQYHPIEKVMVNLVQAIKAANKGDVLSE